MGTTSDRLTLGHVAMTIGGLQAHHIDRLCRRGLVPFERIGRLRLIRIADLPLVREAAERAGYIAAPPAQEVAGVL